MTALYSATAAAPPYAVPRLPLPPAEDAADVLAFLAGRYSLGPKYLVEPAPSRAELQQAAAVSLRAPDHRQLRPFRFVLVAREQRERLAGLFAADAARRGHGAEEVERARERAQNGPALLAVVGHVRPNVEDVPLHEQWISVGAGVMNFLNALHLMGYGAKLLSGASVRDPAIQAAFCRPGETLVAWLLAGRPSRGGRAKHPEHHGGVISDWGKA